MMLQPIHSGERNMELDILRGFATLLILLLHNHLTHNLNLLGQDRVELFFVLSGFLVSNLLFQEIRSTGTFSLSTQLFKRIYRVYPLLLFYILLSVLQEFINVFVFHNPVFLFRLLWQYNMGGELIFMQNYVGNMGGQTWSLAVLEHFSIIWFVLLSFYVRRSWIGKQGNDKLIVGTYLSIFTFCLVMRYMNLDFMGEGMNHIYLTKQSHNRIDSVALGSLLAYFSVYRGQELKVFINRFRLLWIPLAALLLSFVVLTTEQYNLQIAIPSRALGFAIVIAALLYIPLFAKLFRMLFTPIGVRFMVFTAKNSLALYLFHFMVFSNTEMIVKALHLPKTVGQILNFGLGFSLLYCFAYLVTRYVDKPLQKLRRKFV